MTKASDNADEELEKLEKLLDYLGHDLDPSILIGGWATKFMVGGDISRDIDLIINDSSLRTKLRDNLSDYSENSHHSSSLKGRGSVEGIHVDAYIPHASKLGNKLLLRVEVLAKYVDEERIKGWYLLTLEAHLATKVAALLDRADTEKGAKDAREIFLLLEKEASASKTIEVLFEATDGPLDKVPNFVRDRFKLVPERITANKSDRKKLHNWSREWIDEAERQLLRRS